MQRHTWSQERLALALAIASSSMLVLGGCQRDAAPPTAPTAAEPSTAVTPPPAPAYTPPTADQLYQLVAPIALFPDKLLAQTLAASVYPDQVLTAQDWLRSNRNLTAADRAQATVPQPWDPSVKALTAFPDVVDQLAGNLDWTRALGDAYAHDPNDVLNAVQVMRQRAQASGHLRSTPQQQVQVARHVVVTPILDEDRIPPPPQVITIEPAQPDVVYVPRYDPGVVYGTPVDVYRDYGYRPVRWYRQEDLVTTGVVSFGVGVLVGSALEHHHGWFGWAAPAPAWHRWGWNTWGVDWNAPPAAPHYVVYQNHVYAPRTTIINNRTTSIDARSYVRQDQRRWFTTAPVSAPAAGLAPQHGAAAQAVQAMTSTARAQSPRSMPGPNAATPSPAGFRRAPDYAHLSTPRFNAQMLQPGRPVALRAPGAVPATMPSASPASRYVPQMQAQAARPAARATGPLSRTVPYRPAAVEQQRAAMPTHDAAAMRDVRDNQPRASAQLPLWKPPVRDQQRTPALSQAAFARPARIQRPQQLAPPRPEQRVAVKAEPQQHMQRMASFTPPRAAPARSMEPHPARPRAPQQHHDGHHDTRHAG
ncbi:DUF3300 domain-containing protein [Xanthomonas sp. 3058]|uniref:DUF3300 domain-containing protein n=1 Tax=Xanthomonas sp. 3058 TaxID=3035314 RepID=UPI001608A9DB|nr:DUF3300 domain-containing protein [Xanthomonas sp. 3058]